jgi:hypothetical protein
MGVGAGDFDNDGDDDIVVAELTGQGSSLYVNEGSGLFEERSAAVGLHAQTLPHTGFGTSWVDVDNDGWLDLLTANGKIIRDPARPEQKFSLKERMQLLRNVGGKFDDVTATAGKALAFEGVGRGVGFGDLDNDGDVDAVVANDSGPVRVLLNNVGNRNHWLGLRLVGGQGSRDMLGARVEVVRPSGGAVVGRSHTDGSYASASDPRVLIGLGSSSTSPLRIRVHWPDGGVEEFHDIPIDRYATIRQGGDRR